MDAAASLPEGAASRHDPAQAGVGPVLGGVGDQPVPLQLLEPLEAQLVPPVGVVAPLPERANDVLEVVQAQLGLDLGLALRVAPEVLWRGRCSSGTWGGGRLAGWRWHRRSGRRLIGGVLPAGLARGDEAITDAVAAASIIGRSNCVGNVGKDGQRRYNAASSGTVATIAATDHRGGDGSHSAPKVAASTFPATHDTGTTSSTLVERCIVVLAAATADAAEEAFSSIARGGPAAAQEEGRTAPDAVGWRGGHSGGSGNDGGRCHLAINASFGALLLDGGEPLQLAGGNGSTIAGGARRPAGGGGGGGGGGTIAASDTIIIRRAPIGIDRGGGSGGIVGGDDAGRVQRRLGRKLEGGHRLGRTAAVGIVDASSVGVCIRRIAEREG